MRIVNLNQIQTDGWKSPLFLIVFTTQSADREKIGMLRRQFPAMTILGISSYHGVITPEGFKRGRYGVLIEQADNLPMRAAAVDFSSNTDVRTTTSHVLKQISGKNPNLIILNATRGNEERILEGIRDVFPNVPVFGASAAHDKFLPQAFVSYNESILHNGALITLIDTPRLYCAMTSGGYLPTPKLAAATSSKGRVLFAIDGKPAAQVYNEWTDRQFENYLLDGGELPRSVGLYPFARPFKTPNAMLMLLAHPRAVHKNDGSIELFSEIPENSTILLARGTTQSIVEHVNDAIGNACRAVMPKRICAALIMYCAGCAALAADSMQTVCALIKNALRDIPFVGCASFGEQGRLENIPENLHGNMMFLTILITE